MWPSFFHETVTLRKRTFSYGSRFLKTLRKEVLVQNDGINNHTRCFKIGVPSSTAYIKIYEVFFIKLVFQNQGVSIERVSKLGSLPLPLT